MNKMNDELIQLLKRKFMSSISLQAWSDNVFSKVVHENQDIEKVIAEMSAKPDFQLYWACTDDNAPMQIAGTQKESWIKSARDRITSWIASEAERKAKVVDLRSEMAEKLKNFEWQKCSWKLMQETILAVEKETRIENKESKKE